MISVGIIAGVGMIYAGQNYLKENFVRVNRQELDTLIAAWPDPVPPASCTKEVRNRLISEFIVVNKLYPDVSAEEGMDFFESYAAGNGWEKISKHKYSDGYELGLRKGEFELYIYPDEKSYKWRMVFSKKDRIMRAGF